MGRGVLVDARWRAERRSAGRQRPPRLPSRSPAVSFSLPKTDVEDELDLAEGHFAELLLLSKRFRSSPWRPTNRHEGPGSKHTQRASAARLQTASSTPHALFFTRGEAPIDQLLRDKVHSLDRET